MQVISQNIQEPTKEIGEVKIMYRIYGKYKGQKNFKAMNLKEGTQTGNLIYASLLTPEDADKFLSEMATGINPDWQFEKRSTLF